MKKNTLIDINELGYLQQLQLLQYHDYQIPIVDAKDVLMNPKEMLMKILAHIDTCHMEV